MLARQLLNRIGVITRESIAVERIAGGFSTVYPVLKAMEEAGRVRRGYFIAGRGAAQFADAGALERLRSLREAGGVVAHMLAAADPANPYGATLPWPARADNRLVGRFPGAEVLLVDGELAAYVSKTERSVLTFFDAQSPEAPRFAGAVVKVFATQVDVGARRAVFISEVDGEDLGRSVLATSLKEAGFRAGPIRLVEEDHLKGMYGRLTGAARTSVARASMLVWCIRSRKIP